MNDLANITMRELCRFLARHLPNASESWWEDRVVDRLSFQQQRMVQERDFRRLEQLDLAGLLRVLDQNWIELSADLSLPREGRNWIKELQTVRNKWAHASIEDIPASEKYRDADTLERLLGLLDADEASLTEVEKLKSSSLAAMAPGNAFKDNLENAQQETNTATLPTENSGSVPYSVGQLVTLLSDPTAVVPIIGVTLGEPENRYTVFQNNSQKTYYESQIHAAPGPVVDDEAINVSHLHSHLTSLEIMSPSTTNLFSLRSGRIEFVPYQYRPVLKLIRSDRPKLLIADEVGVGKTIEAGLIVKELRARMNIESVLVICPKALVAERKWFSEMKRFDEIFTALDGPTLRHCLSETHLEGEWPEQYAKTLLPFSLFDSDLIHGKNGKGPKKKQGLLDLDPPPQFDLVIVDEAHHIRNPETYLHQGVRYFCDNAKAVIFLTATPVQLGSHDLFTLLNVLRPDLIIDKHSFEKMSEPNRYINAAIHNCRKADPDWEIEASACLQDVQRTEWGRQFITETPAFQAVYDALHEQELDDSKRVEIIQGLEELYTFSSIINRTRRRDIGEFTTRKPETLTISLTPDQELLHDSLLEFVARILTRCHGQTNVKFMMTTIRRQTASCLYGLAPFLQDMLNGKLSQLEMSDGSAFEDEIDLSFIEDVRSEIEEILELAEKLDPYDPKVDAFIKVLQDKNTLPNNKAIVFSTFRHTLAYLAQHIEMTNVRYGLVHGDIKDDVRADIRRRFALPKEDPDALDALLSSEVGCEGLDFQFCDFLVNYDLPWNPMKIEQRIGRIDRYGQKSDAIAIINFITPGTVDADIYERCLLRIGVFEHAIGGGEEILGTITKEIQEIAESFELTPEQRAGRLQQMADNEIRNINEEQQLEDKQAELFGLNIPNKSWEDDVAGAENFWLSPSAIQDAVTTYLAARNGTEGEHILGDRPLKTLRLDQEARNYLLDDYKKLPRSIEPVAREWEKWLKGAKPTLSVTFDQKTASENPETVHLTIAHPLVRQTAKNLEINEAKYCILSGTSDDVPHGEYPFAIYRWSKKGIKSDQNLVAVCDTPEIEDTLFPLLKEAADGGGALPDRDIFEELDSRHYRKWAEEKANYVDQNNLLAEQRLQSLTISHRARCATIEEQALSATNENIRRMRKSELARANSDFDRTVADLKQAINSADIIAAPVVFGVISIEHGTA